MSKYRSRKGKKMIYFANYEEGMGEGVCEEMGFKITHAQWMIGDHLISSSCTVSEYLIQ